MSWNKRGTPLTTDGFYLSASFFATPTRPQARTSFQFTFSWLFIAISSLWSHCGLLMIFQRLSYRLSITGVFKQFSGRGGSFAFPRQVTVHQLYSTLSMVSHHAYLPYASPDLRSFTVTTPPVRIQLPLPVHLKYSSSENRISGAFSTNGPKNAHSVYTVIRDNIWKSVCPPALTLLSA